MNARITRQKYVRLHSAFTLITVCGRIRRRIVVADCRLDHRICRNAILHRERDRRPGLEHVVVSSSLRFTAIHCGSDGAVRRITCRRIHSHCCVEILRDSTVPTNKLASPIRLDLQGSTMANPTANSPSDPLVGSSSGSTSVASCLIRNRRLLSLWIVGTFVGRWLRACRRRRR